MRKLLCLCFMLLFSNLMMAQIDINDGKWQLRFYDDFTTNTLDTCNPWEISHPYPIGHYISYLDECPSGVTHGYSEHQVYQRDNCQLGNGELRLVCEYIGGPFLRQLQCSDYELPPHSTCDPQHQTLYYTSGNLQTTTKFLYGYFEIECRLPIHDGSFPAFWLYGEGRDYYNEIDIFEYSNGSALQDYNKQYTCGIYCDNSHASPADFEAISYARVCPILPNESSDLSHYHVFGCEWLPDSIIWYVDGVKVNEFTDNENIPHHEMKLKLNYAINNYAMRKVGKNRYWPNWFAGDVMIVNYIKVYQLKND